MRRGKICQLSAWQKRRILTRVFAFLCGILEGRYGIKEHELVKKTAKTAAFLLLALLLWGFPAAAEGEAVLVPMGTAIGIRIEADGLLVIGIAGESGASPAYAAGIREGDLLTHVGAKKVTTARELRQALEVCGGEAAVRFVRDGKTMQTTVKPVFGADGTPELGIWLRSGLSGIGTLTWVDPEDGSFAALGHGVSDPDTGVLLPLKGGSVGQGTVETITRGSPGAPGELRGSLGLEAPCGSITRNDETGIYGVLTEPTGAGAALPVCPVSEIHCGDAAIWSDVSGERVQYSARIARVYPDESCRDLLIQVTDARLLNLTGGIVQGMSGSPIIQDGRLVGAVTHVLVSDPAKGYGISAERMLAAEGSREAA